MRAEVVAIRRVCRTLSMRNPGNQEKTVVNCVGIAFLLTSWFPYGEDIEIILSRYLVLYPST